MSHSTPPAMRRIGLLGGMSWESTALYYRLLNEEVRDRLGEVDGREHQPCRVEAAEPVADLLVDEPVVERGALPAHPAQQSDPAQSRSHAVIEHGWGEAQGLEPSRRPLL